MRRRSWSWRKLLARPTWDQRSRWAVGPVELMSCGVEKDDGLSDHRRGRRRINLYSMHNTHLHTRARSWRSVDDGDHDDQDTSSTTSHINNSHGGPARGPWASAVMRDAVAAAVPFVQRSGAAAPISTLRAPPQLPKTWWYTLVDGKSHKTHARRFKAVITFLIVAPKGDEVVWERWCGEGRGLQGRRVARTRVCLYIYTYDARRGTPL